MTVATHANLQISSHRSLFLKLAKQSITRIHGGGGCHTPVEEIQKISDINMVTSPPETDVVSPPPPPPPPAPTRCPPPKPRPLLIPTVQCSYPPPPTHTMFLPPHSSQMKLNLLTRHTHQLFVRLFTLNPVLGTLFLSFPTHFVSVPVPT